jgi:hypothetical protein
MSIFIYLQHIQNTHISKHVTTSHRTLDGLLWLESGIVLLFSSCSACVCESLFATHQFWGKGDIGPNVSGAKYIIPAACVFLFAASSSCSARLTSKRFQRNEAACDWNA